jgi:hypothetical protein
MKSGRKEACGAETVFEDIALEVKKQPKTRLENRSFSEFF